MVHVWTDGSASNNGSETCVSVATWSTGDGLSTSCHLVGAPSSNNVAEIVAAAMALCAWPASDLHLHTDSKLVLGLLWRGLLDMENDPWSALPWVAFHLLTPPQSHTDLHRYLLYLARAHQGTLEVSWVKAHVGDPTNKAVDRLAKSALSSPETEDVLALHPPWGGLTPH